jgi:hypothetical protein
LMGEMLIVVQIFTYNNADIQCVMIS